MTSAEVERRSRASRWVAGARQAQMGARSEVVPKVATSNEAKGAARADTARTRRRYQARAERTSALLVAPATQS